MFPPVSVDKSSNPSRLRWQKSTRRISYVKLPAINTKSKIQSKIPSVASEEESAGPSSLPPIVPTITPSLCIDNQYFSNYINEKPPKDKNDIEYLSKAFKAFAKIQGDFHAQRTNYFEKRGLLAAMEMNIDQQNNKISEALGCLSVCNDITEKYHCTLEKSFEVLVDDFAEKAFKLSSLNCTLHILHETHAANLNVLKSEENKLAELSWRIEREERRCKRLDDKIRKFYENRQKMEDDKRKMDTNK